MGHIFHLAEMALMQSACITFPITGKEECCMGGKMCKLNSKSVELRFIYNANDLVFNKTPEPALHLL